MVICERCNKKIGIFQSKNDSFDKNGNSIILCSICNEEYIVKQNRILLAKEKKENEIRLAKRKMEKEKRLAQEIEEDKLRLVAIHEILNKYYQNCDTQKKAAIGVLYNQESVIEEHSLENLRELIINYHDTIIDQIKSGDYSDIGEALESKKTFETILDFLKDLEKFYKLFKKKKIKTNYLELIKLFSYLYYELVEEEREELIREEYIRIKKKLSNNVTMKEVLKEFIKSPLNLDITIDESRMLLKKFNIESNGYGLEQLIADLVEEVELEDFEENLGANSKKFDVGDYNELNGYEFEIYLEKLFEALNFVVTRTKASGDQGADLIIMKDGVKTAVQVKKYTGKVTNKAIQEVVASKKHYLCQKSMVVTTSEFTKSAIDLAISNDVELWNKQKLDAMVEDINHYSQPNSNVFQSAETIEDMLPFNCVHCESLIEIQLSNLPNRNENLDMECPECDSHLSFHLQDSSYTCLGCKKQFKTVVEEIEHRKVCEKFNEKFFTCEHCKNEFMLDDAEMEILKQNKVISIECPNCNKNEKIIIS